jgi:hypothetical protein
MEPPDECSFPHSPKSSDRSQDEANNVNTTVARGIYWLGVVFMLAGLADALLARFANFDLTGQNWSPLVLGGIGIVLMQVGRWAPAE